MFITAQVIEKAVDYSKIKNDGFITAHVIEKIPSPKGDPNAPLQALIFDSVFDGFLLL